VRFIVAILMLTAAGVRADYMSTNDAILEVTSRYPGAVLSAELLPNNRDVFVSLLTPAGLVQKLLVCAQGSDVKIMEVSGENSSSGRSSCNPLPAED